MSNDRHPPLELLPALRNHNWVYTKVLDEAKVLTPNLEIGPREYWALPCEVVVIKEKQYTCSWVPRFDQNNRIRVDSMEQAKMLKLVHKWENLLLLRCSLVCYTYHITWWCDAFPLNGFLVHLHKEDAASHGLSTALPMRYSPCQIQSLS